MKLRLPLILSVAVSIFLFSCEKEFSIENGNTPAGGGSSTGTAVYTFVGGSGNCTDAIVNGVYSAGSPLTSSNTLVVQVNVTTIGSYILSTNSLNGISFTGSGAFTAPGVQTITLTGAGTPTDAGTFPFQPGTSGCSTSVTVTGANATPAVFSFDGGTGECTDAVINGAYITGTALTAANTVIVKVNVDTIGSYNISTSSSNGVSFSASGSFTATGPQTITLQGTGTPAAVGLFTFSVGTNGCSFSIIFLPSVVVPPGGGGTFQVKIDGTLTTFNVIASTLLRSVATNEKRFDLTGVSTDGNYRLTITIGDSSSSGNNVGIGDQPVRLFLEDDPATVNIDESEDSYAFYTLSTSLGNNNWLTDVYRINGLINISANTPAATTGTISATFSGTLNDYTDPTLTKYTFTEGTFNNISYLVLN